MITLGLSTAPSLAAASTVAVSSPVDPTEDVASTITVSGSASPATRLYVYAVRGALACSSYAGGNLYTAELSGTVAYAHDGDLVSGSYSRSYTYLPSEVGDYRICAYLSGTFSDIPGAFADRLFTTRAATASVSFDVSADPTEEEQVTVTASGVTEVTRRLYVYATSGSAPCPNYAAAANYSAELSGTQSYVHDGDAVSRGAFNRTYSFVPASAGEYRLCGYVSESASADPNARGSRSVLARRPTASTAISISSDPTEEAPLDVTVSGQTEAARRLYVYATRGTTPCPAYASAANYSAEVSGNVPYVHDGDFIEAGAYARVYRFVPPDDGDYQLCSYVAEGSSELPNATAGRGFRARTPTASVTATLTPSEYSGGEALTATVVATSEAVRRLYVFVEPQREPCPAAAFGASPNRELTGTVPYTYDGDALTPGTPVRVTYTVPSVAKTGAYRLCAYVGEDASDTEAAGAAVAVERVTNPNTPLPGRAVLTDDEDDQAVRRGPSVPVIRTPDNGHQRERLKAEWSSSDDGQRDEIQVFVKPPGGGTSPDFRFDASDESQAEDDGLAFSDDGSTVKARLPFTRYGRIWWRIVRQQNGRVAHSVVRTTTIDPAPLTAKQAKVSDSLKRGKTSRRPGRVRLTVHSSPLTRVTVTIRRSGRTFLTKRYTEGARSRRTLSFALSCRTTGRFSYTVAMVGPEGTTFTRRGSWTLSARRCASLRAKESAKRRAKATRERREREDRRNESSGSSGSGSGGSSGSSGGGSAGCDGDPDARPYPTFPGQRDGDGDGCYNES